LTAAALFVALAFAIPAAAFAAKPPNTPPGSVNAQLLAINDFHGAINPPTGSGGAVNGTLAGGVEYLATHIKQLRATNPDNTITVGAGDLIGGSPLVSAAFHDEPTIEEMNSLGLDLSSVGNHEFDEGVDELLRMQNGGCHPIDGCQDGDGFAGASFQYLAANVVYKSNGKPIFPAYKVRSVGGAKIAFIGVTLEGTPSIVSPLGIQNVNFLDEADTINPIVASLKASGIHTFVILIHQGGFQNSPPNPPAVDGCANLSGDIAPIVAILDPDVDIVISGHTHVFYNCVLPTNGGTALVTQAGNNGRLITDFNLTINRSTDQPTSITAHNVVVTRDVAVDPDAKTIADKYRTAIAPIQNHVVGSITADITRTAAPSQETPLGDVIADAQLAYTQSAGAQIAFMNPGGIRDDLIYSASSGGEAPGEITYGECFSVQPFNNLVLTETLTGAQIDATLEQQFAGWNGQTTTKFLQVSAGFTYSYDTTLPLGGRVSNEALNGTPIDPSGTYRVAMNNFIAAGGDGFSQLTNGTNVVYAPGFDVDALVAYFGSHSPVAPGPANRITKVA
jgi:5'-nucleotidase